MTCFSPAAFAAAASWNAWDFSRSGEKCSQKNVTQNAPYAPWNALASDSSSSTLACTTVAPSRASSFALSESGVRVSARTEYSLLGSERIARASPPPWLPVAPMTAMIFLSME